MTALEFFDAVACAVREHRDAELVLAFGPPKRPGLRSGGTSDPVQSRIMSDEVAREVMAATEEVIGQGLRRVEELRAMFGDSRADAVELHYVDLAPWCDVAAELGVTERTVRRWRDVMFDWVDAHGWAHLSVGEGIAED